MATHQDIYGRSTKSRVTKYAREELGPEVIVTGTRSPQGYFAKVQGPDGLYLYVVEDPAAYAWSALEDEIAEYKVHQGDLSIELAELISRLTTLADQELLGPAKVLKAAEQLVQLLSPHV